MRVEPIEPVAQVGDREARPAWRKKVEVPEGFGEQLAESIKALGPNPEPPKDIRISPLLTATHRLQ